MYSDRFQQECALAELEQQFVEGGASPEMMPRLAEVLAADPHMTPADCCEYVQDMAVRAAARAKRGRIQDTRLAHSTWGWADMLAAQRGTLPPCVRSLGDMLSDQRQTNRLRVYTTMLNDLYWETLHHQVEGAMSEEMQAVLKARALALLTAERPEGFAPFAYQVERLRCALGLETDKVMADR